MAVWSLFASIKHFYAESVLSKPTIWRFAMNHDPEHISEWLVIEKPPEPQENEEKGDTHLNTGGETEQSPPNFKA